jgi:hypothetical protein
MTWNRKFGGVPQLTRSSLRCADLILALILKFTPHVEERALLFSRALADGGPCISAISPNMPWVLKTREALQVEVTNQVTLKVKLWWC